MSLPILYSFRRCPFAMRARLAIANSGLQVNLREVVLKNKPSELLQTSAKATVPVLQLVDGKVLEESLDIMYWAVAQGNIQQWQLADAAQQSLIKECDHHFKQWLDKYKYADRHPEHAMSYYREQCESFISGLEQRLSENEFLFGSQMAFADAAIFPFVRQFAHVDRQWFFDSRYLNVQKWLTTKIESTEFKSIMYKYSPWVKGSEDVSFPNAL